MGGAVQLLRQSMDVGAQCEWRFNNNKTATRHENIFNSKLAVTVVSRKKSTFAKIPNSFIIFSVSKHFGRTRCPYEKHSDIVFDPGCLDIHELSNFESECLPVDKLLLSKHGIARADGVRWSVEFLVRGGGGVRITGAASRDWLGICGRVMSSVGGQQHCRVGHDLRPD